MSLLIETRSEYLNDNNRIKNKKWNPCSCFSRFYIWATREVTLDVLATWMSENVVRVAEKTDSESLSNVRCHPFFLTYRSDSSVVKELLEEDFQMNHSMLLVRSVRRICLITVVGLILYALYVGLYHNMIGLCIVAFCCIILPVFLFFHTYHELYYRRPSLTLGFAIFCISLLIYIGKYMIGDASTQFVMISMVLIFTATPMKYWHSALLSCVLTITYYMLGFIDFNAPYHDISSIFYRDMTILILSLGLLAYMAHNEEYMARVALLSQHVLFTTIVEIELETEKINGLLNTMLPRSISRRLRKRETENLRDPIADGFESVSVMFIEVCDFNTLGLVLSESELLDILNTIYSYLDSILDNYDCHKVETIGEIYLIVSGCPTRNYDHAEVLADLALDVRSQLGKINELVRLAVPSVQSDVQLRFGINTGPVVAGLIGKASPRYKLFGDTVNTASRMQSTCAPGMIHVSESAFEKIRNKFELEFRGSQFVKGKGNMPTYYLKGRSSVYEPPSPSTPSACYNRGYVDRDGRFASWRFGQSNGDLDRDIYDDWWKSDSVQKMMQVKAPMTPVKMRNKGATVSPELFSRDGSNPKDGESAIGSHSRSGSLVQMMKTLLKNLSAPTSMKSMLYFSGTEEFQKATFPSRVKRLRGMVILALVAGISVLILFLIAELTDNNALRSLIGDAHNTGSIITDSNVTSRHIMYTLTLFFVVVATLFILMLLRYEKYDGLHTALSVTSLVTGIFICAFSWITEHPSTSVLILVFSLIGQCDVMTIKRRVSILFVLASVFTLGLVIFCVALGYQYESYTGSAYSIWYFLGFYVMLLVLIYFHLSIAGHTQMYEFFQYSFSKIVSEQKEVLKLKQKQTNEILSRLLPPTVVSKLTGPFAESVRIVERYDSVTVLVTDMVNFTKFAAQLEPMFLMEFLNEMYTRFDAITLRNGLYRVEIIGDSYLLAGGCPENPEEHAFRVIRAATEMMTVMHQLDLVAHRILKRQQDSVMDVSENSPDQPADTPLEPVCGDISIRIGVHSGPVIAGVVGFKDPRYHLFGETVRFAKSLEARGEPGRIHISESVKKQLDASGYVMPMHERESNVFDGTLWEGTKSYFLDSKMSSDSPH